MFSKLGLAIGDVSGVACRRDRGEGIGERIELLAVLERFVFPAGGVAVEEEKGERTKPKKRFALSLDASFPVLSGNWEGLDGSQPPAARAIRYLGKVELFVRTGDDIGEHRMEVWAT